MEILEFLNERKRMCSSYKNCNGCPLREEECRLNNLTTDEEFKKIISTVEQWSKEHQSKTRQSVFLEQYPEAHIGDDGVLQIKPCSLSASYRNTRGNCATMWRECSDCRRKFWCKEIE